MQQNKIEELKQYGFVFNGYQGFIDKANLAQMAMDASLLTPPNSGIPVEYTAFLDPAIIRILNAPRRARKIVGERKIGDWNQARLIVYPNNIVQHWLNGFKVVEYERKSNIF